MHPTWEKSFISIDDETYIHKVIEQRFTSTNSGNQNRFFENNKIYVDRAKTYDVLKIKLIFQRVVTAWYFNMSAKASF